MKNFIRLICFLLSLIMAYSLLFSVCAYASNANPTVTVQGERYAVVSNEYVICVNFDNMQGIKEGYFILKFNPDVLRYIGSGAHDGLADSFSGAVELEDGKLKVGCGFAFEDISDEYCYPTFEVIEEGSPEISIEEGSFEKFDGTTAKISYNFLSPETKSYAEEDIANAFFGGEISFNQNDIIFMNQSSTVSDYKNTLENLTFANVIDVNGAVLGAKDTITTGAYAVKYFSIKAFDDDTYDYLGIKFFAVKNDVNCDGYADIDDARAALRDSVGLEKLNYVQRYAANKTGEKLTVEEARMLLRTAVGLE